MVPSARVRVISADGPRSAPAGKARAPCLAAAGCAISPQRTWTAKTITIEVRGDNKREADEYFYLDLFGNSSNSLFAKSRGTGTILNDD